MSTTVPANTATSPARSPPRSSDDIVDTTPLLSSSGVSQDDGSNVGTHPSRRPVRRQSLREAARFLRRASSRRMMREPSMLVREAAAEQLEERQSDWAYSKPVVILDIVWNFAFVAVAASVLLLSREENPSMPLRLWIVGYALQCALHMVCVCVEYRRRRRRRLGLRFRSSSSSSIDEGSLSSRRDSDERYVTLAHLEREDEGTRYVFYSRFMKIQPKTYRISDGFQNVYLCL